jgi:signal transduction histidine kinase
MRTVFDNLRLQTKLLLMMVLLSLLMLLTLFVVYTHSERQLIEEVESHTADLTKAIQVSVEQLTTEGKTSEDRLQEYLQRLQRRGVGEVSLLSSEQEVIASTNPRRIGSKLDAKRKDLLITARLGEDAGPGASRKTYNVILPVVVGDEKMGYVHITMLLDDFTELLKSNNLKRLAATVFVFALGMSVSLYLSWRYTRPIHQVVAAAKHVASGNLSRTLPSGRRDEIGELTESFNEMVERLRTSRELESRLHQAEHFSSIGQLASGIAHEIRNPLNFINLSIDHLKNKFAPADPEAGRQFQSLIRSVKEEVYRLNVMVENFLQYGKPLKLHLQPASLADLVKETLALASEKAAEQQVAISETVEGAAVPVQMDARQVKTCLMNVILNALQAMPHGGHLTLRTTYEHAEQRVTVACRDTGGGIPPETLEKVFEPYYTTKQAGIGLGLALTKKILLEHGGDIRLESRTGEGTTATLYLPFGNGAQPPAAEGDRHEVSLQGRNGG